MNYSEIKKAILDLNQEQLRELNNYVVDRSKFLSKQRKSEFSVGQRIKCQGEKFTISKINRSRAICVKEGTTQSYNIPFGLMEVI